METTLTVRLKTVDDVKNFSTATMSSPVAAELISGRYTVDAKSIMGIFSLDLSSPLKLHIEGSRDDVDNYYDSISDYIIE